MDLVVLAGHSDEECGGGGWSWATATERRRFCGGAERGRSGVQRPVAMTTPCLALPNCLFQQRHVCYGVSKMKPRLQHGTAFIGVQLLISFDMPLWKSPTPSKRPFTSIHRINPPSAGSSLIVQEQKQVPRTQLPHAQCLFSAFLMAHSL